MIKELVTVSATAHLIANNAMSKTILLICILAFYHNLNNKAIHIMVTAVECCQVRKKV